MNTETTQTTETEKPRARKAAPKATAGKPAPKGRKAAGKDKGTKKPPVKTPRPAKPKGESVEFTGPAVLRKYAADYHHDKEHKTAGGHVSVDCNDDVANKLRGKDIDQCYAIAAKVLEVPEKELRAKYAKLNVGMQRMNLGNRIRAAVSAK